MSAASTMAQAAPNPHTTRPQFQNQTAKPLAEPVRSLLLVGERSQAAHLAVKRLGKAKTREQGFLVLDYAGKLAHHLSKDNSKSLGRSPMSWLDLCNRRKPLAIWRLAAKPGMPLALAGFLRQCAQRLKVSLSADTIASVCALAWRVVGSGTMGLVSLVQSLRRPELNASLRMRGAEAQEMNALIEMLHWLLRFPLVWAASEGNNQVDIEGMLHSGHTVWLEMAAHYAEPLEHEVLGWMAQACLLQVLGAE